MTVAAVATGEHLFWIGEKGDARVSLSATKILASTASWATSAPTCRKA